MSENLFTTVIAVDAKYVRQLQYSVLTWQIHRPQLFKNPLVVIIDRQAEVEIRVAMPPAINNHPQVSFHVWPDEAHAASPFVSQRERMLSAFVHLPPRVVKTPWWLKIDCDVLAYGNADGWLDTEWMLGGEKERIIVAPRWGYSKPGHQPGDLDNWGNQHPVLRGWPPLNIPYSGEKRLGHERICSWVSFYNTAWSHWAASLCEYPRIPVPSQDGFHWYVAARSRDTGRVLKVNMKRLGWDNISKLDKLKAKVEAMFATANTR